MTKLGVLTKQQVARILFIEEQIKDEDKSAKMYAKWGFPQIARDEARHKRILIKEFNKYW